MILTRPGNKRRIAQSILAHFPAHEIYVEPFFGAGGMFFSKPKARHNIVNDYDSEVYNLFRVIMNRKEELREFWSVVPIHEDLWKYWKTSAEGDPIRKAARFLILSNFSFMGRMGTLMYKPCNTYTLVEERIKLVHDQLRGVKLMNCDFRQVLPRIGLRSDSEKAKTFVYCDPPYCETSGGTYDSFTRKDTTDLFDCLVTSGLRFAISEFDHPYVLELARLHGLKVIPIGERQNMKNRRLEVLITNY